MQNFNSQQIALAKVLKERGNNKEAGYSLQAIMMFTIVAITAFVVGYNFFSNRVQQEVTTDTAYDLPNLENSQPLVSINTEGLTLDEQGNMTDGRSFALETEGWEKWEDLSETQQFMAMTVIKQASESLRQQNGGDASTVLQIKNINDLQVSITYNPNSSDNKPYNDDPETNINESSNFHTPDDSFTVQVSGAKIALGQTPIDPQTLKETLTVQNLTQNLINILGGVGNQILFGTPKSEDVKKQTEEQVKSEIAEIKDSVQTIKDNAGFKEPEKLPFDFIYTLGDTSKVDDISTNNQQALQKLKKQTIPVSLIAEVEPRIPPALTQEISEKLYEGGKKGLGDLWNTSVTMWNKGQEDYNKWVETLPEGEKETVKEISKSLDSLLKTGKEGIPGIVNTLTQVGGDVVNTVKEVAPVVKDGYEKTIKGTTTIITGEDQDNPNPSGKTAEENGVIIPNQMP
jgi:hypothetical protein